MKKAETGLTEEIRQVIGMSLPAGEAAGWLEEYAEPYRELMTRYRCAMMEVETKFRVLSEELSLGDDRNPIETIKVRLKKPESILNKLKRNGFPMTVESIERNINDIAGVRVICSFSSDIYMLADSLLKQDDVILLQKKDYIAEPKPNGYRSLHLIIATPIFLHNSKRLMKVEIQLRTLAMDMWASLEHKLSYKKNAESADMAAELLACAEISAEIDRRMEKIYSDISSKG